MVYIFIFLVYEGVEALITGIETDIERHLSCDVGALNKTKDMFVTRSLQVQNGLIAHKLWNWTGNSSCEHPQGAYLLVPRKGKTASMQGPCAALEPARGVMLSLYCKSQSSRGGWKIFKAWVGISR